MNAIHGNPDAGYIPDDYILDPSKQKGVIDWMAEKVKEGKKVVVLTPEEFKGYEIMKRKERGERA